VTSIALVREPERVHLALSPARRRLLEALHQPQSATQVATAVGMTRQQANYHLRVLEAAGLVELTETRQRRGCTERVLRATAGAFVVDPAVMQPAGTVVPADRHAAEHLVATAGAIVRDVTRMQAAAGERRLLTFTIEADVGFHSPADVEAFTVALADAVATVAHRFHDPDGRRYRVVAGGHPAPAPEEEEP
jgi:DNA-binding transcriptional ArsR family regulator